MAYPPPKTRTYWRPGVVEAVRGDVVFIRSYGHLYRHPWWELREPPKHRRWARWRFQ